MALSLILKYNKAQQLTGRVYERKERDNS